MLNSLHLALTLFSVSLHAFRIYSSSHPFKTRSMHPSYSQATYHSSPSRTPLLFHYYASPRPHIEIRGMAGLLRSSSHASSWTCKRRTARPSTWARSSRTATMAAAEPPPSSLIVLWARSARPRSSYSRKMKTRRRWEVQELLRNL